MSSRPILPSCACWFCLKRTFLVLISFRGVSHSISSAERTGWESGTYSSQLGTFMLSATRRIWVECGSEIWKDSDLEGPSPTSL